LSNEKLNKVNQTSNFFSPGDKKARLDSQAKDRHNQRYESGGYWKTKEFASPADKENIIPSDETTSKKKKVSTKKHLRHTPTSLF